MYANSDQDFNDLVISLFVNAFAVIHQALYSKGAYRCAPTHGGSIIKNSIRSLPIE